MRTLAVAIAAVAATVALAAGFVLSSSPASGGRASVHLHGDAVWGAGARPAPPIRLRDQHGRAMTLAALRGTVLLVTFMDSHCTTECPVEGHQLAVVQRSFPPARRPDIVVVSVNPADTPRSARRFARRRGWHGGWRWLMGSAAELSRVWRAYGIEVDPTSHDIVHSAALYIVDRHGDERSGYVAPFLPKLVTADVRALEAEGA
jgi:cytochrome oxidase Cu insertion factor (SCO1/SenC/PrrC family)